MYRNMAASLIEHGAVVTTEPKAKEVRRFVEKLITTAKKGTLHARRLAISMVGNREIIPEDEADASDRRVTVITKLFDEIAPRYAGRPGGYTRIIRMGETRIGDSGEKVMLQLITEEGEAEGEGSGRRRSRRRKRAQKRYAMAGQGGGRSGAQAQPAQAEAEQDESSQVQDEAQETPEDQPESDQEPQAQDSQAEASQEQQDSDAQEEDKQS
jgi:large subunit ribosomal protein L17